MYILVACEESGVVTEAFRKKGHTAFSCDLLPTSSNNFFWHIQGDVKSFLTFKWDMIIAFPPCTDLSVSGARWFAQKRVDGRQQRAINFFMSIALNKCPKIAIENPVGIMSTYWRKPDQVIQPWQFGHGETKATCLWLKNLPLLMLTKIVPGREARVHKMGPSPERGKLRSKTYQGIADAMAEQWG